MAGTFPPKISPTLMTPDPHFIPGYSGFCPQYRYSLGKTYGQLTSQLLTNPDIRRSELVVLQSNPFPPPRDHSFDGGSQELGGRRQHPGDPNLTISMIPGYTGTAMPPIASCYWHGLPPWHSGVLWQLPL
eukprot:XP_017945333.1 PREDICTED: protein FAM166B [Xenopus tropicalis]